MGRARALSAILALVAPACFVDDAPPASVRVCPTPSMLTLYPGMWPPSPYGPKPAATGCVAERHDAIIVLGCPNDDDGTPSACQEARADIAVGLSAAGFGDRFITTGGAVHNGWVEADTLKALLVARGVPVDSVLTDVLARHTDENIYYASRIMQAQGWTSALVVTEDPGQLVLTGLCDANCCVDLGRLTLYAYPTAAGPVVAGHYNLAPWAPPVTKAECEQIEIPSKFMCVNLPTRRACAGRFQLAQ